VVPSSHLDCGVSGGVYVGSAHHDSGASKWCDSVTGVSEALGEFLLGLLGPDWRLSTCGEGIDMRSGASTAGLSSSGSCRLAQCFL